MRSPKWFGVILGSLFASSVAVAASSTGVDQKIDQLDAQTKQLQQQVQALKAQLTQAQSSSADNAKSAKNAKKATPSYVKESSAEGYALPQQPAGSEYFGPERFAHGVTITTSPWMGLRSAFDTYDLLYQQSSMNEDLTLLSQRQYMQHMLTSVGDSLDNRALVAISGGVEGQMLINHDYDGVRDDDIDLSTAELDISAFASSWANLFISMDYDDASSDTGSRVSNSNLYLSRGFLTIGNLDQFPMYFTIGQMYAPFGRYATALWTMVPVTKSLARIDDRMALVGFTQNGFYAEAYGFQGNKTTGDTGLPKQGGLNAGYKNSAFDVGAGYVTNMADSQGMQATGLSSTASTDGSAQFAGFGVNSGANALAHDVPGLDLHAEYNIQNFTLIGEFITATERFAASDLTYNGQGAKVNALHSEVDYNTELWGKPVVFGGVYERTAQSLALNLPKDSYMAVMDISIWKGTVQALEYRHDVNYGQTAGSSTTGDSLQVPDANVGGTRNMISLLFGVYF